MKRYDNSRFNSNKRQGQQWHNEYKSGGFKCSHCKQFVIINDIMGTVNRNHCNMCLWSKHVDEAKGDRRSTCNSGMQPIGLTLKHEGYNKIGEIMLIHICLGCQKISINRIARDDPEYKLVEIFNQSLALDQMLKSMLKNTGIYLLRKSDKHALTTQLYGS